MSSVETRIRIEPTMPGLAARVSQEMESAARKFLQLGVQQVEAACNKRREWFLSLPDEDLRRRLDAEGLSNITAERARDEAQPLFKLIQPRTLIIKTWDGPWDKNPDTPMVCSESGSPEPTVHAFLPAIRRRIGGRNLTGLMYYEMLHACGDFQMDGVVGHNMIGIEAVKELVGHP